MTDLIKTDVVLLAELRSYGQGFGLRTLRACEQAAAKVLPNAFD